MTPEELQNILNWISVVAGIIGVISFIFNVYQHFKIQSLRQGLESIDRIGKSAKMECSKLENNGGSGERKAEIRVLSGLVASILNVTTTHLRYNFKNFEKKNKSTPFISVD